MFLSAQDLLNLLWNYVQPQPTAYIKNQSAREGLKLITFCLERFPGSATLTQSKLHHCITSVSDQRRMAHRGTKQQGHRLH
jgi:hypothetical protein